MWGKGRCEDRVLDEPFSPEAGPSRARSSHPPRPSTMFRAAHPSGCARFCAGAYSSAIKHCSSRPASGHRCRHTQHVNARTTRLECSLCVLRSTRMSSRLTPYPHPPYPHTRTHLSPHLNAAPFPHISCGMTSNTRTRTPLDTLCTRWGKLAHTKMPTPL